MNISLFNKKYVIRRFGEQRYTRGYVTSTFNDFTVSLNVHPPGAETLQALPEGERMVKRLEAHGSDILRTANQETGEKGDLLYYNGEWYECVSAVMWDHTLLNHWNYGFALVPADASGTIDLSEPYSCNSDASDDEEDAEETEEEVSNASQ